MPSSSQSVQGGKHDAEFEHPLDVDLGDARCSLCRTRARAIIEDAVDAVHQPFERGSIELIGAAEAVHHARLSPLCVRVPDALCEGVVGDRRAVAILPLSDAQILAPLIAIWAIHYNNYISKSCA